MASEIIGVESWEADRDDNGHRNYMLVTKIKCATPQEGPATVLQTPGMPTTGSTWNIASDVDNYAYCTPYAKVTPMLDGERQLFWLFEQKFTTRPMWRCNDTTIENPLDEPAAVTGGFAPYREEAITDRFGDLLMMSSLERMRGPEVEIEKGRPFVTISMNVATLPLATFSEMMATGAVNDSLMWGLPARCIRLAEVTWQRFLYGVCTYFYRVNYTFEVKFDTWNRLIVDQGTRVKMLDAPLSATNPMIPFNNPLTGKPDVAFLDGDGNAVYLDQGAPLGDVWIWEKELETEYNFFVLNIPTSF
jgi:hypothetical protein